MGFSEVVDVIIHDNTAKVNILENLLALFKVIFLVWYNSVAYTSSSNKQH